MIRELRVHDSHDEASFSAGGSRRDAPLMCPNCQEPIRLSTGLCGNRQIDAILLQAERIGAELDCHRCGLRFVYHRVHAGAAQRIVTGIPESSSTSGYYNGATSRADLMHRSANGASLDAAGVE